MTGWDADPATLRGRRGDRWLRGRSRGGRRRPSSSSSPCRSARSSRRRATSSPPRPEATVTDVGSTKRAVAAVDDPRFVPGHPVAGGATGGPARASADLFDGATWFLTPSPDRGRRSASTVVERFVASLGARPVRLDADTHDRLLAVTSHLPHALANLLMHAVARAGDDALGYAGASLREMTRVAGANPDVWADIFVENGDLIAEALESLADALADVERALRDGDRAFFERWIEDVASTRTRMLEYAYRTDAKQLNRIRVRVPDKPGVLARITQTLGAAGDQHRGLRAASRLARVRRRARHPRRGRRQRRARADAAPPRGLLGRLSVGLG